MPGCTDRTGDSVADRRSGRGSTGAADQPAVPCGNSDGRDPGRGRERRTRLWRTLASTLRSGPPGPCRTPATATGAAGRVHSTFWWPSTQANYRWLPQPSPFGCCQHRRSACHNGHCAPVFLPSSLMALPSSGGPFSLDRETHSVPPVVASCNGRSRSRIPPSAVSRTQPRQVSIGFSSGSSQDSTIQPMSAATTG